MKHYSLAHLLSAQLSTRNFNILKSSPRNLFATAAALLIITAHPLLAESDSSLVMAADYYVSASGNDSNDGRTPDRAWRTVTKVNNTDFAAGDRVLFEGGQTFNGTLQFSSGDSGQVDSRVVIGSYGTGRAVINGGNGSAIRVSNAQYINVTGINTIGAGRKTGNNQGDGVSIEYSRFVNVEDVEASGFQRTGVRIFSSSDVRVNRVYAHDNGFAGIFSDAPFGSQNRNQNVYVGYSRALNNAGDPTITNNHSGNGILFYDTSNSLIEFSEAAYNGWDQPLGPPNGPVGIWTARSDHITIQYCISHDNDSTSGDGGGFDFDGGTTYSLIQYCYSYNNYSFGYLFWEYGAGGINNNVVRYSISENDRNGGFGFGTSGPGDVKDIQIYNNVVYNSNYPAVAHYGGPMQNIAFRNNIFMNGAGAANLSASSPGFSYQNNVYWRNDGGFSANGYSNFIEWANATGQEKLDGQIVGIHADPKLNDPGNGAKLTDPTQLPTLTAYLLRGNSPLINRGLNLNARYGINVGSRDFYGNSLPYGLGFDIGAHEYQGIEPPTPQPGNLLSNGGFENGQNPWNVYNAAIVANEARSGVNSARITGETGGVYRTITNLQPNTTYTLSGYLKAQDASNAAYLYAKNFGGEEVDSAIITASGYTFATLTFKTGTASTSAEIGVWKFGGSGNAFADDLKLEELKPEKPNLLNNGGFENGQNPWNVENAVIVANNAFAGIRSAKITGNSGGVWHTITGLQPNTTYTLSGVLKAEDADNGAYLYIKNYGGAEVDSPIISSSSYLRTSVTFTTGANNTSAEIGIWKYSSSGSAYADDLFLQQN